MWTTWCGSQEFSPKSIFLWNQVYEKFQNCFDFHFMFPYTFRTFSQRIKNFRLGLVKLSKFETIVGKFIDFEKATKISLFYPWRRSIRRLGFLMVGRERSEKKLLFCSGFFPDCTCALGRGQHDIGVQEEVIFTTFHWHKRGAIKLAKYLHNIRTVKQPFSKTFLLAFFYFSATFNISNLVEE